MKREYLGFAYRALHGDLSLPADYFRHLNEIGPSSQRPYSTDPHSVLLCRQSKDCPAKGLFRRRGEAHSGGHLTQN